MPIYSFLGARLVLELLEKGLQCQFIALGREEVLHTEDELGCAYIVEIEVLILVAGDITLLIYHLCRIFLQIFEDAVVVGCVSFLLII